VIAAGQADRDSDHPPRPVLTLRVGISGHRPKPGRFSAETYDRVNGDLGRVFAAIDVALHDLYRHNSGFYSSEPWHVRLVTGMAEGADQMAVWARRDGWTVDAVLPFPRDSYRKDFQRSASDSHKNVEDQFIKALSEADTILELPEIEDPKKRDLGYSRLGDFLVSQIDLLVAIWDGRPEQGVGGTAVVIRKAIEARVPVVWIAAAPDMPLGSAFPRMIEDFEDDGTPVAPAADCTKGLLKEAISTIVSLPEDRPDLASEHPDDRSAGATIVERLSEFFKETWPRPSRWVLYDLYRRLIERRSFRFRIPVVSLAERRNEWQQFLESAPPAANLQMRLREVLLPRYLWADQLAIDFANRYRTAYMLCYLLSALAVVIALFGIFFRVEMGEPARGPLWGKWGLVLFELIVIMSILHIYWRGRNRRWHQKWIEYRALAEMLRDLRFLAYFTEYGRIQRADVFESPSAAWFLWYLRASARELGLPHAIFDGAYQHALLTAVDQHVIADQLAYHRLNAETLARMNGSLRRLTDKCFKLTVGLLVAFGLGWPISLLWSQFREEFQFHAGLIMHFVTFGAAFLPALGAALAGIIDTGDFRGFARRSARTVTELENLRTDLNRAKRIVSLDDTSTVLVGAARVLTEDLVAWQSLYSGKRLNLPG
jgi:hypothetical protein